MWDKFKSTLHELADSKKAVTTLASMLAACLAVVIGFGISLLGRKLSVPDEVANQAPDLAVKLAAAIVSLAVVYVHGQAKVDVQQVASKVTADDVKVLVAEGVKAALKGQAS